MLCYVMLCYVMLCYVMLCRDDNGVHARCIMFTFEVLRRFICIQLFANSFSIF